MAGIRNPVDAVQRLHPFGIFFKEFGANLVPRSSHPSRVERTGGAEQMLTVRQVAARGGAFLATKVPDHSHVSKEFLIYIRKMQNDALIAFSCWARGFTVVTCSRDDFEKLRVFWKAAKSRLTVEAAPTFPSVSLESMLCGVM